MSKSREAGYVFECFSFFLFPCSVRVPEPRAYNTPIKIRLNEISDLLSPKVAQNGAKLPVANDRWHELNLQLHKTRRPKLSHMPQVNKTPIERRETERLDVKQTKKKRQQWVRSCPEQLDIFGDALILMV